MTGDRAGSILFIDDDRLIRWYVKRALSRAGYDVHGVASVAEAMKHLEERCPNLVITDLRMPGESGFVFLERLQSIGGCFPVIVCSAFVSDAVREQLSREGVVAFLEKPFRTEELLAAVEDALSAAANVRAEGGGSCRIKESSDLSESSPHRTDFGFSFPS